MSILTYIVPFIFVLTVVVFFHELGHFLVGRWCGVKVDAFSIGFGPELLGREDRHGTRWRIAAIPLGGYVKFHGDANGASVPDPERIAAMPEEERKVTFAAQPVWKRAAIVLAGPRRQFRPGDRDLHRPVRDGRARCADAARRHGHAGERRGRGRLPAGRSRPLDRRSADR